MQRFAETVHFHEIHCPVHDADHCGNAKYQQQSPECDHHVESIVTDFLSQQCHDHHDTFDEGIAYLKEYGSCKENVAVTNITKDDELELD